MNRRDHEYKNQINAILAIAESNDKNALEKIIHFSGQIFDDQRNSQRVTIISENSYISALLLRLSKQAQDKDVRFATYIERPFPNYRIPEPQLITLLSNLLNNAFEAAAVLPECDRDVYLEFRENTIKVINKVDQQTTDLSKLSLNGYSTKGPGRGFGMSNIISLAEVYNIALDIKLNNSDIIFTLTFAPDGAIQR